MRRRLTIVTQWFPPEQAPFGRMMQELAVDLVARGWEVTVITGFPNHPAGKVFEGYRKRWLQVEEEGGVRVLRVWLATSAVRSVPARIATFLSFTVSSSWRALREPPGGVLFAVLQPLSVGLTLPLVARLRARRLVFNIQDLHPDTQIRLGMVRQRWLIAVLHRLERFAYRHCAALTCICSPFAQHAVARGADPARVRIIPNWIDTQRIRPEPLGSGIRREAGVPDDAFVALWAGTLGLVSGADVLLGAAERLRNQQRIHLLVVGEGPLRESLVVAARERGLDRLHFLPFQPEARLLDVQNAGDVSIVTLARDFAESSVPSKVLAYMAAGRGVVAAVPEGSPTASLLAEADCGRRVDPGDVEGLARMLVALADDPGTVEALGLKAREHAVRHLSRKSAADAYDEQFSALLAD